MPQSRRSQQGNDVNRYNVRCPYCGQEWRSTSVSGVTRCGECRTRIYVPVDARPRRYMEEQRARRRGYGEAASHTRTRSVRRRDPDAFDPADPVRDLNERARPAKKPREVVQSRPSPARPPPLTAPLISVLARPVTARPPAAQAPVPRTRLAAPHSQHAEAPPLKRTRAVLACGHVVILGGSPESWCGVAAPCPTCAQDLNVTSTEPASA
jgi:hypothetical protein